MPEEPEVQLGILKSTIESMPLGVVIAQTVVIREKIYIGGGGVCGKVVDQGKDEDEKSFIILECSMARGGPQWNTIVAPNVAFGMAAVDDKLIIAGGGGSKNQ